MHQNSIFTSTQHSPHLPLAERLRPERVADIVGQDKLLAENGSLRQMIDKDDYSSFILWGPPGCGKTTIARLIKAGTKLHFYSFSGVMSKIKDVKELMVKAQKRHLYENRQTIIFVDEIHRFNKSQQDAFLPYIEAGSVILIGATTENPSFEIIPALLSRCHTLVLNPLSKANILLILEKALHHLPKPLEFSESALFLLAEKAAGDARVALNDLEIICRNSETGDIVGPGEVSQALQKKNLFYDKGGEEHYNIISALQKSIRGSDVQAAVYWLARMVEAGEDPLYITRRLVRIASEDIGLADPQALSQAVAVKEAVHFLGMPEANTALCQLVVYLASAPKSNALETAYLQAKEDAERTSHMKVPLHLRNAPTGLMKDLGYGKDYKYSHNFENHYSYQKCFPQEMEESVYYKPSSFGFEKEMDKRLKWWESLKKKQPKTSK